MTARDAVVQIGGLESWMGYSELPAFQLLPMPLGLAMHRLHLRLDAIERGDTAVGDSEASRQLIEIS